MFEILFFLVATLLIIVAVNVLKDLVGFVVRSILRPTNKNYNTVTK